MGLAAGLTLAAVSPAGAELPVIDNSNLVQQIKGYLQDLKSYATQLQQLQQEVQQVQWLISTYQSFVHDPSLGGAMALLGQVGIDNPLPVSPVRDPDPAQRSRGYFRHARRPWHTVELELQHKSRLQPWRWVVGIAATQCKWKRYRRRAGHCHADLPAGIHALSGHPGAP